MMRPSSCLIRQERCKCLTRCCCKPYYNPEEFLAEIGYLMAAMAVVSVLAVVFGAAS